MRNRIRKHTHRTTDKKTKGQYDNFELANVEIALANT